MTGSPAESQPEEASESEIHSDEESVALYLSVVADLYLLDGPVAGAPGKTEVVAGRHGDGIQDKDGRDGKRLRKGERVFPEGMDAGPAGLCHRQPGEDKPLPHRLETDCQLPLLQQFLQGDD